MMNDELELIVPRRAVFERICSPNTETIKRRKVYVPIPSSETLSINTTTCNYSGQKIRHLPIKNHSYSILRVPTTQFAKMSIDLKFVKLTADVLEK